MERTSTRVGQNRFRVAARARYQAKKRGTNNLKKTTRRGAYKPARKKAWGKRRRPFVETKAIDDLLVAGKAGVLGEGALDDTLRNPVNPLEISNGTTGAPNTLTMLPINSFFGMQPGFTSSDMIGDNVFSRYLKCKLEFELPSNDKIIRHPCDVYLVHGWVTLPMGLNYNTTPEQNDLTRTQLNEHILNQLKQYFNQRSDKLQYTSKRQNNIKILGYRKLKPNNNNNLGGSSGPIVNNLATGGAVITGAGGPPLINMSCSWPMNRKVIYYSGKSNLSNPVNNFGFLYPNFSWLPFCCVYNPTADEFLSTIYATTGEPKIKVRYNSKHYFSDS